MAFPKTGFMRFPWEEPVGEKVAVYPAPQPTVPSSIPIVGAGLDVIDLAGPRILNQFLVSPVYTDAPGANTHDAFSSFTAAQDLLLLSAKSQIATEQDVTMEAGLRVGFDNNWASHVRQIIPEMSIHKHSVAPYVDHNAYVFPVPMLVRRGQTIYANGYDYNTSVGNADIQFVVIFISIPVSMITRLPIFAYTPNRRD